MPAKIKESEVERQIVKFAKDNDCLAFKFVSPGQRGVPDRLFLKDGKVLFLEIKQKGKAPTPIQEFQIRQIREQGIAAHWAGDVHTGNLLIDAILLK